MNFSREAVGLETFVCTERRINDKANKQNNVEIGLYLARSLTIYFGMTNAE
jgi:hypothetical protein